MRMKLSDYVTSGSASAIVFPRVTVNGKEYPEARLSVVPGKPEELNLTLSAERRTGPRGNVSVDSVTWELPIRTVRDGLDKPTTANAGTLQVRPAGTDGDMVEIRLQPRLMPTYSVLL